MEQSNTSDSRLKAVGKAWLLFLTVLTTLIPLQVHAQGQSPAKSSLIVKTARGLTQAQAQAVLRGHGAGIKKSIPALDLHIIEVPTQAVEAITSAMKKDSANILRVDEDRKRKIQGLPADTLVGTQWALPKIAWDQVYGTVNANSLTTIAILDTGLEGTHGDFAGVLAPGASMIDDSNGITDSLGHGTWLAGIVAARTNNGLGIAGVGYDFVEIMPVKVLDGQGQGQDSNIIQGVVWAADNGAKVILMAFSSAGFSQSLQDAIDYAWSKDIVLVAAAGNDGTNLATFPAGDRGVIGVSATDQDDNLASFSTYGASVFLGAPGVGILGTTLNSSYGQGSGSSASAAIVAGAAALMRAVNPSLANGVIVNRLARNAEPAGTQDQTGNGRIQIERALADTNMDFIQPAGASPLGNGGPFVGPYRAAAPFATSVINPTSVMNGSTTSFTLVVTNTSTPGGGTPTLGSFIATVPAGITVSNIQLISAGSGLNWTNESSGSTLKFKANSTADQVPAGAAITINFSGTATTGGLKTITTQAFNNRTYGGGDLVISTQPTVNVIAPITITPTFTATSRPYNGTNTAAVTFVSFTPSVGGDAVTVSHTSATFSDKNAGNGKTVTISGLTLNGVDASKYVLSSTSVTATANITALGITGSFTAASKPYDGNTTASVLTRSLSGVLPADTANVTLDGGTATFANANAGTAKTVTLTGATLAGSEATNYSLTSVATTTADITAIAITANFTAESRVYNGTTTATVLNRTLNGVLPADTANVTLSGGTATFDTKNIGTAKTVTLTGATLAGSASANYNLTSVATTTADITPATVTPTASASNKVYNGNNAATASISLSGIIGTEVVTATGTASFDNKNVGTGKTVTVIGITLGGADAGNYVLSSTSATTTATITALAITGSFTASNKTYDGSTSASVLTRSLSGVLTGDIGNITLDGGTAAFADANVGIAKTVTLTGASLAGIEAGNYSLTSVSTTTADITALAITGNFTAANKVYDATTAASILTRTLNGVLAADSVNVTLAGGTATFPNKNAGTGKTVTLTGATLAGTAAGNYSLTSVATTTADITPATVTPSATAGSRVYNGTTSATATVSLAVILNSDNLTAAGTATFDSKNVGTGKTVTISGITLGGTDAGNYVLSSTTANTTANITALGITGAFTAGNKIYDGNTSANVLTRTLVGVLAGDIGNVSLDGGTATFANANVGTGKTVTLTGATLAGSEAGNYSLTSVATTTADITALAISGSFTAGNKIYDATTAASVLTRGLNGVLAGDFGSVALSGGTATFDSKNVGTGKTVTLTGATLTGGAAGNYSLTSVGTATADITPATLTASATASNRVYNGTTSATASLSLATILNSDVVTATGTATFADKNVGNGKTVTITGITLSGADAGNYVLFSTTAQTTANITALAITGGFTAANKTYDGNTSASVLTRSLAGVLVVDDGKVSLDGGTATFANANVGTGKTVTLSGATLAGSEAINYSLTSVATTTADITARAITGYFTAGNKVYDSTTAASVLTRGLNEVLAGDVGSVALSGGTATFDSKNVGTGKTVTLTGATLTGVAAGNYSLTSVGTTTADITHATLTASATASNRVYNGNASATATLSLTVILGNDIVTATGTANFDNKNVGNGKIVEVNGITLSGADASNYVLSSPSANTTANITALAITGAFTASNKTYDGNTSATVLTRSLVGVLPGDVGYVNLDGGTATFADANVGSGKIVTLTGATLSGSEKGNYSLTSVATASANISALGITGTFDSANKVYDGTTTASAANRALVGVLAGDLGSVALSGGSATFDSKNFGTGKTVTLTGATITGSAAGNYSLTSVATTTANITQASLTLSAVTNTKVYDATVSAAATPLVSGLQTGDSMTTLYETYDTANVGTGKTLSVTYVVNDSNNGNNYIVSTVPNTTGVITPAPTLVTNVTVTPNTRQYSDLVNLSATPVSALPIGGSMSFYINYGSSTVQLLGTVNATANGGAVGLSNVALLETVTGSMNPGAHTITAIFTPLSTNFTGNSGTTALTVTEETSEVTATHQEMIFTAPTSGSSATVNVPLSATIRDITEYDAASDPNAGDIRNARVDVLVGNTIVCAGLIPSPVSGNNKVGTVACTVPLVGDADGNTYDITYSVKNYYKAVGGEVSGTVNVALPGQQGFLTGGGHIRNALTAPELSQGTYAGTAGAKTNMGFNVKPNKSNKNLQGNVNLIVRSNGRVYQFKSTAIDSLTITSSSATGGKGFFLSKANLKDITDPLNPIAIGGNLSLTLTLEDNGEPGTGDSVGISILEGNTLLFSSSWNGTKTILRTLSGGNFQVR